jgi:hypothetical protein
MPEQPAGEVAASNWLEEAAQAAPEKPEEAKPAEDAPESTEESPQAKEKVEKVVPLAALHEERAKRREAAQREAGLRQELEAIRRQQLEILQRQQQPAPPPDAATDPLGALVHNQAQTQQRLDQIALQNWNNQQAAAQRQQYESFVSEVRTKAEAFVQEQPDANDGISFLKNGRVAEYKAMGMTTQEAQQRMLHDEWQLSQWALQNGENPAQVAYNMAIARGYVAPEKKLDMQARGQNASMPHAGGGKSGGTPSLETLLKMDSKEFAKATSGDNWAKLMKKHGA